MTQARQHAHGERRAGTRGLGVAGLVATLGLVLGSLTLAATPAAAATVVQRATVGMPFIGKWAVAPSSHPSVEDPDYGDWATDLTASAGTPVRLHVTSADGPVTFTFNSTTDPCGAGVGGGGVLVNVLVNGEPAGTVLYEHLDAINSGPSYANGDVLGTITNEPTDPTCDPARSIHIELKNATNKTNACYVNRANNVTVDEGAAIGQLGSPNTAKQEACATEADDGDSDGLPLAIDRCPKNAGPASHSGCPGDEFVADASGDGKADSVVFFVDTGQWYVAKSTGSNYSKYSLWITQHGMGAENEFLRDVNKDGKADAVIFFGDTGQWYVSLSTGSAFAPYTLWITGFGGGTSSTNQLLVDVTGDGRADAITVDAGTGTWRVAASTGTGFAAPTQFVTGFGTGSAAQMASDVTGDGVGDAVAFNPDASWTVAPSNRTAFKPAKKPWIKNFGTDSDNQLLGDVDGDMKADALTFEIDTGVWSAALSTGTAFAAPTVWATNHGATSAGQLIGDSTGDCRADAVAYFGPTGNWYVAPAKDPGPGFDPAALWIDQHGIGSGPKLNATSDPCRPPPPTMTINDPAPLPEGNSSTTKLTFTITLSAPSDGTTTVDWTTANGTGPNAATAPSDFKSASGTVTFKSGRTTATVAVVVKGDVTVEPNETFFVNLSNPVGATIADGQGVGTISNDDT